jgi:hypothetical protein
LATVDIWNYSNHSFDDLKAVLFGDLARASGNPILYCCVCPWEWMASSPAFS